MTAISRRSHHEAPTNEEVLMTSSPVTSSGHPDRPLLVLTSALVALQVLNLTIFDDLRTDPVAGVLETFTKPQHLSSIAAVLLAVILVAVRHRAAASVAGSIRPAKPPSSWRASR